MIAKAQREEDQSAERVMSSRQERVSSLLIDFDIVIDVVLGQFVDQPVCVPSVDEIPAAIGGDNRATAGQSTRCVGTCP